jgi:predicted nucleic acid-binding protein
MIYFDAAYIAKCYLNEPGSPEVLRLAATVTSVVSCEMGRLELISVLRRHCREGRISEKQFLEIWQRFEADEKAGAWTWAAASPGLIGFTCEQMQAMPKQVFLRSADALHLACAKQQGFAEVYTNDRHMLAAAPHFGLTAVNVVP